MCFWVASAQAVVYPRAVGAERPCSASGARCVDQAAARSSTLSPMVATTHMLAAGALALKARSLKHGLTIGVLSHLMLDAVPHRDYRWGAFGGLALGVDLAGGALAVGKLSGGSRVVLAGALGGVLPDIVRPAERALHLKLTTTLHDTIHTAGRPPAWSAVAVQGLTVASAVLLLRTATRGQGATTGVICDLLKRAHCSGWRSLQRAA